MLPSAWAYSPVSAFKHPTDQTVQTGPFGAQLHSDDYVEQGVPFILIRNMKDGSVDDEGMPRITHTDAQRLSNYALAKGDIVFSRVGRVGSCFLAEEEHVGWIISGQLLRMRLNFEGLSPRFLVHWIQSSYIERHIANESVGSTRQSINSSILSSMPIPRVPYAEQVVIANLLDTLDTALRETEAIIAKLKAVKQGLLHDLLTRGIDANGELRPPQTEAPHLYKQSPLGWIPKKWRILRLDEFCVSVADGTHDSPQPAKNGYPLVTSKNLRNGFLDLSEGYLISAADYQAVRSRSYVEQGDILFGMIGTVGNPVVIGEGQDQIATKNIGLLRIGGNTDRSRYLCDWLKSSCVERQLNEVMSGSTQKFIGLGTLRALLVLEPAATELVAISSQLLSAAEQISSEMVALDKLRSLKGGLMDDLLTGRVRVTPLLSVAQKTQSRSA